MVGAVVVEMLVADLVAGAHHEGGPELRDAASRLVNAVAGSPCPLGAFPTPAVGQEPEEPDPAHGRGPGGAGVVVDQDREGDVLVGDECRRVAHAAGTDGHDLGALSADLVVAAPQLRGVLAAEQSAEVAQEDEDHRPFGPEVAQPSRGARRVGKLQVSQLPDVHRRTLWDNGGMTQTETKSFRRMDESTAEQWAVIGTESFQNQGRVADRVLGMLESLADITDGFAVDQLTHCLQTATRAERAGADDEVVIASLCHDVGKAVSVPNHPAIAAEMLKPYVRDDVYWMIKVHQDFQGRHYYHHFGGDPNARDQYQGHPAYELAERFADEWDQAAFDADYDTLPLEHFEPRLRELFATPKSL